MSFSRSLVPQMLRPTSDWWDLWDFPPRIFDQHFGLGLTDEDLLPLTSSPFYPRAPLVRRQLSRQTSSPNAARGISEVSNQANQFAVSLDVSQFAPNEITVKAVENNCVVIEGKHEERPDEHGYISRHFQRRYMLPKGIEADKIVSSLSPDGILTVSVPKVAPIEEGKPKEKVIPINFGSSPMVVDLAPQVQSSSSSSTNTTSATTETTSQQKSVQQEKIHQIQVESSAVGQQASNVVQQPIQQTEPAKPANEQPQEAQAPAQPAPVPQAN